MSRRDLSGKRPSNGSNTADRRSNLRSKGKKWREQLVQGVKEKELSDALNQKLNAQRQLLIDRKMQLKREAKQLDIDLGFVDPSAAKVHKKVPEWKKQKNFLNAIFPPPVISRKYNGVMVYRNKLSMQEYWHRVITPEEWDANMELLNEMRALYDQENPEQQGVGQEEEDTQEQTNDGEEGDESGEDDEEEQEGEEEEEAGDAVSDDESAAAAETAEAEDQEHAVTTADEVDEAEDEVDEGDQEEEGEGSGADDSDAEEGAEEGAESESESVDGSAVASLSLA